MELKMTHREKKVIKLKNDIAQWQIDLIYARSQSLFSLALKKLRNAEHELNLIALPKERKTRITQHNLHKVEFV